jgi:hypothetical protein
MENAMHRRSRTNRSLVEIPEFQDHLRREGIDLAEFARRQHGTTARWDATTAALALAKRKVDLNCKGK